MTIKQKRNRKKIKTAEIKMLIEPKYKEAIKTHAELRSITMTDFITEAIILNLLKNGWLEK